MQFYVEIFHTKDLSDQVDDIVWSYLVNWWSHSTIDGHRICWMWFALALDRLFVLHLPWHCFQEDLFHDLSRHRGETHESVVSQVLLSTLCTNGSDIYTVAQRFRQDLGYFCDGNNLKMNPVLTVVKIIISLRINYLYSLSFNLSLSFYPNFTMVCSP